MKQLRNAYAHAYGGVLAAGATLIPAIARAEVFELPAPGNDSVDPGVTFEEFFQSVASSALNIVLLIAGVLAVFYLIWSGIQYITAGGSPDKAKTARAGIINAVIGIIVIIAAFFIVRFAVSGAVTIDNLG